MTFMGKPMVPTDTVPKAGDIVCGPHPEVWPAKIFFVGVSPEEGRELADSAAKMFQAYDGIERRVVVDHDQTDLGASDDRPCGCDSPIYRSGSE